MSVWVLLFALDLVLILTELRVDMGLSAPDLVAYIDTSPTTIRARPQVSYLFSELELQEQIYNLYNGPNIWEGVRLPRHQTCDNKWESRTRLMNSLRGDSVWKRENRIWIVYICRRVISLSTFWPFWELLVCPPLCQNLIFTAGRSILRVISLST